MAQNAAPVNPLFSSPFSLMPGVTDSGGVRVCGGHASRQADKLRSLVNSKFRTVIIEQESEVPFTSMFYNYKGHLIGSIRECRNSV